MTNPRDTRRRGWPLIVMLSVLTVFQLLGLVLVFYAWQDALGRGNADDQPFLVVAMVATGVALVALAGIWAMRRWAVYLFAVVAAFGLISDLVLGVPLQTLLIRIALLAGVAVLISQRWENFH